MGSRKLEMMKLAFRYLAALFAIYAGACAWAGVAPDGMAVAALFAAMGIGQGSANWANAEEHKAKKGA